MLPDFHLPKQNQTDTVLDQPKVNPIKSQTSSGIWPTYLEDSAAVLEHDVQATLFVVAKVSVALDDIWMIQPLKQRHLVGDVAVFAQLRGLALLQHTLLLALIAEARLVHGTIMRAEDLFLDQEIA